MNTGGSDQPDKDPSLGIKALEGSMWMIGATGAAKGVGLMCQIALAWFLTKKDYGVYAIAISLSVFLSILRDGGLPLVLEQQRKRFDFLAGPIFWMMLGINSGTGLLIALVAQPAAQLYHIPELAGVITLFAITIPLGVLPSVLSVRAAVNLKFRELGVIQVVSATTRNGLMLLFAWSGFGARSLLLPLLITNVTDTLMLWMLTRFSPWTRAPKLQLWPELFRSGRWVLIGTFAIGLGNNGAYFLLGNFLPSDVVGTYFFAYQIVVQLGVLLSDNVYQVLVASFVRMDLDLPRIRAAVARALRIVVLVGATASLSIAAIYEPLERLLWHGKWSAAAHAVYVLAVVWPAVAGLSVLRALQMATGRFRQWGTINLISAMASVCGTVMGAYFGASAADAAIGFGIGSLFGAVINASISLASIGARGFDAIVWIIRPWVILVASAICAQRAGNIADGPWPKLIVSAICFATVGVFGLRVFAKDSFWLVVSTLRQTIQGKLVRR
jgi:lipopolysaccharide exporter